MGVHLGVVVAQAYGDGVIVALSDARLLRNGALILGENQSFLGSIPSLLTLIDFYGVGAPTVLQLATTAGAGSSNPSQSLANARIRQGLGWVRATRASSRRQLQYRWRAHAVKVNERQ